MDDLISRQDVIDALWRVSDGCESIYGTSAIFDAIDGVKALPSARPERKTCGLECLRCKQTYEYSWDTMDEISYTMYSYCPDCIRKGIQLLKSQDKKGE